MDFNFFYFTWWYSQILHIAIGRNCNVSGLFQAYQAFKLVLLSLNWINWIYLSIFVEIVQMFSQPMRPDHFSDFFFLSNTEMNFGAPIFSNGLTIKSTGFNFLAYSIARYDHLQAILFCPLPTCGESPIGDLRTQSRKNFRDKFFFTKLVEGSSSVVLKDLF